MGGSDLGYTYRPSCRYLKEGEPELWRCHLEAAFTVTAHIGEHTQMSRVSCPNHIGEHTADLVRASFRDGRFENDVKHWTIRPYVDAPRECPNCSGMGGVGGSCMVGPERCPACDGTGRVPTALPS